VITARSLRGREDASGHFVEHHTEGEKVGALIEFPATQLLRRHVSHGADCGSGLVRSRSAMVCESPLVDRAARAILANRNRESCIAPIGDEYVGRLDVPVHDALLWAASRASATSIDKVSRCRAPSDFRARGASASGRSAFHDNEEIGVVLADFVHGADVGWFRQTQPAPHGESARAPAGPGKSRREET